MLTPLIIRVSELTASHVLGMSQQGELLKLPKSCLYGTPLIGEEIQVIGMSKNAPTSYQEGIAHALLNELLSPPSP